MEKKYNIKSTFQHRRIISSIFLILLFQFFTIEGKVYAQSGSQAFVSTGTFTVPAGIYCVTVETWGGGGAGGGATGNGDHCGGGGGGGAYNRGIVNVIPGNSYNVTVGSGGIGGTGNGGGGGPSSFNGLIIANGGNGGSSSSYFTNRNGGHGGNGGSGGLYTGGDGGNGYYSSYSGGGGGGAGDANNGGNASGLTAGLGGDNNNGSSNGGDGGAGLNNVSFGNGTTGNLVGAGGSGGKKSSSGSNANGGNGARGQVVVSWAVCTPFIASITAEYCARPGYIRLTAHGGNASSTYLWSNGATTNPVDVNIAGVYNVTITNSTCCTATASYNISNELVVNGDFSAGYTGFTHSSYIYKADVSGNSELVPEGTFGIGSNPQNYHSLFWGRDHTTGSGNFMIVNGFPGSPQPVVWSEIVTVVPGTTYYFSAWAISLNSYDNYATLQFSVNNTLVGTTAALPPRAQNNNPPFNWIQFYGTWTAPAGVTSVSIEIIDLQTATTGNDFGLDDISFATLTPIPIVISLPEEIKICSGGTVNISPEITGGKPPYAYNWTGPGDFKSNSLNLSIPDFNASKAGMYQISVTDGYGCPAVVAVVNVIINDPPAPVIKSITQPKCSTSAGSVELTNLPATGTWTLKRMPDGVTVTGSGDTKIVTDLSPGNAYTFTVTNDRGCTSQLSASVAINSGDQLLPYWLKTPTASQTYCVQNIVYASWDLQPEPLTDIRNVVDETPVRPDYHVLTESEKTALSLDPAAYYADNSTQPSNIIQHWSLTETSTGNYITDGNGNLLDDETDAIASHSIRLEGASDHDIYYQLKYWLEDACGNISGQKPTVQIVIKPRPIIVKNY